MVDALTEDGGEGLSPAEHAEVIERLRDLDLTSCDFCGGGCCDPDCYRCYSPLRPENLRTLAQNLANVAMLCWAWQLREVCPTWKPGCGALPSGLPPFMEAAIASPHIGVFLRRPR